MGEADTSYTDSKGRTRWHRNEWLAERLKELADFLVIGGYEESHAVVYKRLTYVISRYPESVAALHAEGRLEEVPDVGPTIAELIGEYLETGTCGKMKEWADYHPLSLLEMTAVQGLGAKMARTLYREHGIGDLRALGQALDDGKLAGVRGFGKKMEENVRAHIRQQS